jgi:flagellar protein FlaG
MMAIEAISGGVSTYQDNLVQVQRTSDSNSDLNLGILPGTETAANKQLDQNKNNGIQQKNDDEVNAQRLKSAISQANYKLKPVRTGCEFSYNEEINRVSIKVVDKDTKEVIREIPPEESLKMLEKIWEIAGLLVDEKR